MFIKKPSDIKSSEITPKTLYINRRQFMAVAASLAAAGLAAEEMLLKTRAWAGQKLPIKKRGEFSVEEKQTSFKDATHYNNFYEFSTDKEDVAELASKFRTRPWTISIEGHVKQSKVYDIDALIKMFPLEERVYRFRCVEAWSMVLPWVGFALGDFIKICEPTSKAKYVKFTTIFSPEQMPGQKTSVLQWPYEEGLRMDEAVHPLTLLTVGMYGEILPNQNGAPLRLVAPWKYGFKNIKSIVKISFVEEMPVTTWMKAGPREYGFYANVNPDVDHPRWSQAQERRIGEFLKKKTLMFNGYAEQVA
ncbi:MAG: protein-methionine-sulfoxide reductase catalytic subunit MsrP, partial [Nitrospirota bacterium]